MPSARTSRPSDWGGLSPNSWFQSARNSSRDDRSRFSRSMFKSVLVVKHGLLPFNGAAARARSDAHQAGRPDAVDLGLDRLWGAASKPAECLLLDLPGDHRAMTSL